MITLFDVVERINLEKKEIDSIFRNKSRHMINLYAKEGLGRLGMSFALNIHGWTVNVPIQGNATQTETQLACPIKFSRSKMRYDYIGQALGVGQW